MKHHTILSCICCAWLCSCASYRAKNPEPNDEADPRYLGRCWVETMHFGHGSMWWKFNPHWTITVHGNGEWGRFVWKQSIAFGIPPHGWQEKILVGRVRIIDASVVGAIEIGSLEPLWCHAFKADGPYDSHITLTDE